MQRSVLCVDTRSSPLTDLPHAPTFFFTALDYHISMSTIAVLYATGEGQTAKVAHRIAEILTNRGHTVIERDVEAGVEDLDWESLDGVLVGASIHMGTQQSSVRDVVSTHRSHLNSVPSAFFQISLSSATENGRGEAASYVDSFLEDTGWDPDRIGLFGGALRYSKYGFLKRLMMKQIAKRTIEGVETDKDAEFTDWEDVEAFAADVAIFIEQREDPE